MRSKEMDVGEKEKKGGRFIVKKCVFVMMGFWGRDSKGKS